MELISELFFFPCFSKQVTEKFEASSGKLLPELTGFLLSSAAFLASHWKNFVFKILLVNTLFHFSLLSYLMEYELSSLLS